jgi:hypothetical protein
MGFIFSRWFFLLLIITFLAFASGFGACLFDWNTVQACSTEVLHGWKDVITTFFDDLRIQIIAAVNEMLGGVELPFKGVTLPKINLPTKSSFL